MLRHNADASQTYKMAINQFSVLTDEEFAAKYLTPMFGYLADMGDDKPAEVNADIDWSAKGMVSPIKNQGQCGSCWAFSTTGVLESMALQKGRHVSLSEQQLVDCSGSYGNQGCNGGWPASALKYVKDKGLISEGDYPYTARTGTCKKQGGSFSISSIHTVTSCSGLSTGIQTRPLSVVVDARNWSRYGSGVFSNCGDSIDHAVLLVGVVGGNWKIKNSWGSSWGERGYIRLAAGNTCAVCKYGGVYGLGISQARTHKMQLFVRGTLTHTLEVQGNETVQDVKTLINEKEGFSADDLVVMHAGRPMEDEEQLASFSELTTLDVQVRMLGGKVHGSLARAGKVRGQTPKVEKQEKKKSKTGRAKRRMQYNRRFVNVVATFGRKKGPNARS